MAVEPPKRPGLVLVWNRERPDLARPEASHGGFHASKLTALLREARTRAEKTRDAVDVVEPKDEATPLLVPTGKTWSPSAEPPKNGGLHQLTLATIELPKKSAVSDLDFTSYRPGLNNRALLGAIVKDLEQLMGVRLAWGYAHELEAHSKSVGLGFLPTKDGGFKVGERAIDALVAPFDDPKDKQAIAAFAIAHEYFHALLQHADIATWAGNAPKGFRVKNAARFRKVAELQVDYLATKYLMLRGLPTDAVLKMFETGRFEASADYPSGQERADNVRRALEPGFALELFQNDILDCLAFLDFLAGGPPP
ncbi:hypothetical protein L6R52_21075 [Myxococcota bacterium]|nr:hypothetical protein [Myxococcota bacterium]